MFSLLYKDTAALIQTFEEIILTDTNLEPDLYVAQEWFNNMTVFIDFIITREQILGDKVQHFKRNPFYVYVT